MRIGCSVLAFILFLAGSVAGQGPAAPLLGPTDYSATMVIHLRGNATQRMNIAKRGSMWRSEIEIPGRGQAASMTQLIDFGTKTAYMIMPQMCMQSAMPNLPPAGVLAQAAQQHAKVVDLGPATVSVGGQSYAAEHRQVRESENGTTTVIDVYTANDLQNFPVKTVMTQGEKTTTVTYENIQLTSPPASEFTPPGNCRSMPGMSNMPGLPMR